MEPITLAVLGAGALYLLTRKKTYPFEPVKGGKTGHQWLARVLSVSGTGEDKKVVVELYSPEKEYGPHVQTWVATYEQTGSDKNSRVVVAQNPDAIPQMITDAGLDFNVHKA